MSRHKYSHRTPAPVIGRGVIKCAECGTPTRDHSLLGPCPELVKIMGTSRMTVPTPRVAKIEKERAEE